uniref:DUF4238 domain-containing protein n=1 Tax=Shewanella gaetbuli TaxID=220752 RepID=UPI003B5CCC77
MSKTRDNHYVPQWHQKGFVSERVNELCHLKQKTIVLPNGEVKVIPPSKKWQTPTQRFYQRDLYTTFFGAEINDEIEKKLFGYIDDNGSHAVKAFLKDDQAEWHKHFKDFFSYLDAQKIRTPKGLDWIQSYYPALSQNDLMKEMQSLRTLHCTLWAEGVRELVSAEDSEVKFIVSDHPVTVYNYACSPDSELCEYPNDPDISLKGSQTIFPLDKNRCLILTNLEYAKDSDGANPLESRTNATKMRQSMVNTIEFINSRKLTTAEVTKINYIIKSRAHESVAGGSEQWLYPENDVKCDWADLRHVLLPPSNELYRYGGEMYAKFDDGHVHYQDAFGRETPENDFLNKVVDERKLGPNDHCGCGSGKKYKKCCRHLPIEKRSTWAVLSVRERNLALCHAIRDVLELDKGKSWNDVRRGLSDEQVSEIYRFYSVLWPVDTDIYSMLPKSNGKFRGLYTGPLDVRRIGIHALNMAPHFDEFLIQHPFINPNNVKPEFSPVESPSSYKYQALKDFYFMLSLEPYIVLGLVNLIPDPCCFDYNLHREMLDMATSRKGTFISPSDSRLHLHLMTDDFLNSTYMKPRDSRKRMLLSEFPNLTDKQAEEVNETLDEKAKIDPLIPLQDLVNGETGQFMPFSMSPNYEMGLFLAQATGSVIVTDSESRWIELHNAQHRSQGIASYPWRAIYDSVCMVPFDRQVADNFCKSSCPDFVEYRLWLKSVNELVASNNTDVTVIKEKKEQSLEIENKIKNGDLGKGCSINIKVLAPEGGLYDTNVQRLLLKSHCTNYLDKATAVYYVHS